MYPNISMATDLVRWAEKQVWEAVINRFCLSFDDWKSGVSFDDLILLHASFSSEAGVVLTFFVLRQKE